MRHLGAYIGSVTAAGDAGRLPDWRSLVGPSEGSQEMPGSRDADWLGAACGA